jgi:carboxymethylenebutenolidase
MATELISFKREDGTEVPAYATPAGPKQGLVVLQEWWGVNDQVKTTATDIAKLCGVRVAIPDLYRTKIAYEAAEAQHLMSGLDWGGAVQDVKAAAAGLKAEGCNKVGVVGFCMGGALSLGCAVKHAEIDACIAFYGWNDGLADVSTMTKPTQCHFGKLDDIKGFSDAETAAKLEEKLKVLPHLLQRVCSQHLLSCG